MCVAFAVPLAVLSNILAGGGHGTYWPIALSFGPLFPILRLLPIELVFLPALVVAGSILYACYAHVAARARRTKRPWIAVLVVAGVHYTGAFVTVAWAGELDTDHARTVWHQLGAGYFVVTGLLLAAGHAVWLASAARRANDICEPTMNDPVHQVDS